MKETIPSRVSKLEIGQPVDDEAPHFRVFGVELLQDGTCAKTNLKTGNTKAVDPATLGIEHYLAKEGAAPAALPRGATLEIVPEPAPTEAPEVNPQDALDAYVASHHADCSMECAMQTRRLVEAVKTANMRAAARHVGEYGVW